MNLTLAEVRELPLAAALLDLDGTLIARTPEWNGAGPGTVLYSLRVTRLAVATGAADPAAAALLDLLLAALGDAAGAVQGVQQLRITMLSASLRVVAGRQVATRGSSHDVIDLAVAGIGARTELSVRVEGRPAVPVAAPEVAALCLVQLAVNAERHTRTSWVTLVQDGTAFHVVWPGRSGRPQLPSSRRHLDRARWGLGFCRIAADTLGGAVIPPTDRGDGMVAATLELGLQDLALPLAAVRGQRVHKATRTWDEETGCVPGAAVEPGSRLAICIEAAAAAPGRAVARDGWRARLAGGRCWIAIPPDDVADRARDVVDGLVHERALWEGVPEPHRSRVFALSSLLGGRLGSPMPRVPAGIWNQRMAALATELRLRSEIPRFSGLGAMDPRIVAHLVAELDGELRLLGDALVLELPPDREGDPRVSGLERAGNLVTLS